MIKKFIAIMVTIARLLIVITIILTTFVKIIPEDIGKNLVAGLLLIQLIPCKCVENNNK